MIELLSRLFYIFLIYSIGGWVVETIRVSLRNKNFVNRGFLLGPYCPIYGFGAVTLDLLLNNFLDMPIVYFFLSIFVAAILEYFTSYILEKEFNARWWDYSDRALNVNGRICLENLLQFAFFAVVIMCFINKRLLKYYYMFSPSVRHIICLILFIIVFCDFCISFYLTRKVKSDIKFLAKDNTKEVSDKVKELIKHRNIFTRRIFLAYPDLKLSKLKEKIKEVKDDIDLNFRKEN
ncbi:MAG: putative ABC transporter permease [Clostridia bacterium]|nr:putative ABC transporter permease [Clostridia bacterium]